MLESFVRPRVRTLVFPFVGRVRWNSKRSRNPTNMNESKEQLKLQLTVLRALENVKHNLYPLPYWAISLVLTCQYISTSGSYRFIGMGHLAYGSIVTAHGGKIGAKIKRANTVKMATAVIQVCHYFRLINGKLTSFHRMPPHAVALKLLTASQKFKI